MSGGRLPTPLLTYGSISVTEMVLKSGTITYKARARYRDVDGVLRTVSRYGQTKARARTALRTAMAERYEVAAGGTITRLTKLSDLAELWLEQVRAADRSARTIELYTYTVARYVVPFMGGLRVGEVRTALCDDVLRKISAKHGPSAAKTARACLNGMLGLAVRHDAIPINPFREAAPITVPRSNPRALTVWQSEYVVDRLRANERAVLADLPDLVEFMLGTGARIGEVLAARRAAFTPDGDPALDLNAGTWEINATVVRAKGKGLAIQPRTKTEAGWRRIALPRFVVEMIRRRDKEVRWQSPEITLFPSPFASSLRDPSNTNADLRTFFDGLDCDACSGTGFVPGTDSRRPVRCRRGPYSWVHSHTFRKTVASRMDEAGMSARDIADQLGHAHPSMTTDVYLGRHVVSARAAEVLDR